jgi:hypothetical protein
MKQMGLAAIGFQLIRKAREMSTPNTPTGTGRNLAEPAKCSEQLMMKTAYVSKGKSPRNTRPS